MVKKANKRDENRKQKLYILQKIKEKKSVLFGAFSDTLTKKDKQNAWEEVCTYGKSIGVIASNKNGTYLRDTWWPNLRKTTVEKIDNARQTGSGGGIGKIIDEVDSTVRDIIGKESPVIRGLGVEDGEISNLKLDVRATKESESGTTEAESGPAKIDSNTNVNIRQDNQNTEGAENNVEINDTSMNSRTKTGNVKRQINLEKIIWRKNKAKQVLEARSSATAFSEKQRLQIELLKVEIYKTKLEARELEIKLGIHPVVTHQSIF
ncbi:hypothetical protein ABEB36_010678 [Hypothenemus hampei]|uniref:Regulatory protein zeste n=1 Tax=Hypothenemus hampei TaxID=57062 RepID=A0ABD1ECQ8_HYPHA